MELSEMFSCLQGHETSTGEDRGHVQFTPFIRGTDPCGSREDPVNSSKHTDSGMAVRQVGISGGEGVDPNRNDLAYGGFLKWSYPNSIGWFKMETHIRMDDWEYPHFGNHHILILPALFER